MNIAFFFFFFFFKLNNRNKKKDNVFVILWINLMVWDNILINILEVIKLYVMRACIIVYCIWINIYSNKKI